MNVSFTLRKFWFFIKKSYKKDALTYLFFLLSIISCVCTYCFFYNVELFNENQQKISSILYFDLGFIFIFLCLACNKITYIWRNRHKASSRFILKLIAFFSFISILPAILMCTFSSLFFHNGLESWFNLRNQTVLRDSLNAASSYLEDVKKSTLIDTLSISRVIENCINKMDIIEDVEKTSRSLGFMLDDLCSLKGMNGAILITSDNIIAHSKYSVELHFLNLKYEDLTNLTELADLHKNGRILNIKGIDKNTLITAACFRLSDQPNNYVYLITEKKLNPLIVKRTDNARKAFDDYYKLLNNRSYLEKAFIVMFFVIGLLILVISIMLSLIQSWKFIQCISNLIDVSEAIMEGNFSARAIERKSTSKEIFNLTQTFNQMISQIHKQQNELIRINNELDEKVKFITNVLSGISSGVIGLDNSCIYIWNENAEKLLGKPFVFGENIFNILPELQEMFSKINEQNSFISKEIHYKRNNKSLLFSVKIVKIVDTHYSRYVITFDDLTDMIAAQHKAAWSDVARRVAHEIKNPLTPIQLSAERLHRKYINQITEDKSVFSRLTDTIIRQVNDIKRLIDEFSFFARLPEPKLNKTNLEEICHQAIFLMNETAENVKIHFNVSDKNSKYMVKGDDRLLHQCIVNIIKNGLNALSTVQKDNKAIWINLAIESNNVVLTIEDNGPGFPSDKMNSLATPYFTLLPKGTGLGLSIVKKIIQDHHGSLNFDKSDFDNGAKVTIIVPLFTENTQDNNHEQ